MSSLAAILCVVGIAVLSGFAWLLYELAHAPYGYEDATGWHWGEQPRKP